MAGKLFNVFAIVLFLGVVLVLVAEGTSNHGGKNNQLKKKTIPAKKSVKKFPVSDDEEFMFADEPAASGDGEVIVTDNESNSNPPMEEIDPGFSVNGLPDVNELLTEGEIDIEMELASQNSQMELASQNSQMELASQNSQMELASQNSQMELASQKPPVQSPVKPVKPVQPVQPPCKAGQRCPSVKPPPLCQTGRRCQSVRRQCQSKRTCQSRRPCQSTKRPCPLPVKPILPPAFSPTKVCGKTMYCRNGYRGPCNRNEIFTPVSGIISRPIQPTCPSISTSSLLGCISSSPKNPFAVKSSPGYCTIRYPQKPCFGYPSTYRFSKRTKQCYPATPTPKLLINRKRQTTPGPCPADQFFTAVGSSFGTCRCNRPNYLRCQKTNRCYPAYTKGTCSRGQWMVPYGDDGLSTCRTCPCPSQADGRHIYWSGKQYGRPGCYKSQTRGPCRQGMRFVIGDILTGSARCVPNNSGLRKRTNSSYETLLKDWDLFYGGEGTRKSI